MLALMCRAYQERCLAFPTRRVSLHDRCLRGLLHDWKKEEKGEEGIAIPTRLLCNFRVTLKNEKTPAL
jgi:hypothetical protein